MASKPFPVQKKCLHQAYLPNSWPMKEFCDSEWTEPKTNERWIAFLQKAFDKQIVWLTPWMPHVPFALLVWREVMGTVIVIIGGNQLCSFYGSKIVWRKAVHTCY